ncbi:DUF302 domain-containing protein [Pseudomonas sp. M30-35]|uniref:DUF302 domain-containing protein n=1 Tax=Pseudomonas sp. M30-35 TaxID=1981174 RepID=UPI000B3C119D|nr:DUF302 domain-containing protein [Pseudomonas sp. M30-35]ARU86873.1 hypothetical protein B9K09_02210 [Pseudomonas sp. M30-35]
MNLRKFFTTLILMTISSMSYAADGLITLKSPYNVSKTMQRVEHAVTTRELTIFAKVDHAAGAAKVDMALRPTQLLIFGNPKGGTPLMECAQTSAIDLPLKVLVWQDASEQVWVGYNDPAYIGARHGASDCPVITKLQTVLQAIADETVAPQAP